MSERRADQLVEAGVWLQATGDVDGARRLFEQALRLDPVHARARQLLSAREPAPPPARSSAPNPWTPPAALEWEADDPQWSPSTKPKELSQDALTAWDTKSNPGVRLDSIRPPAGDPFDLLEDKPPGMTQRIEHRSSQKTATDEVAALLRGAMDLLRLDDHSGAMDLLLKAHALAPDDPRVHELRQKSESTLLTMFESKLGALSDAPRLLLKEDDIIWLNLDHRAGFVLAQIDGSCSYEDVFAVSGMSRVDTARILAQLVEEGVIKS